MLISSVFSNLANYIAETKVNVEIWWNEHKNPNKDSEQAQHLRDC